MRLTDEQVMQDNKIFAHHNVLTELKYCGWEIPNRKSISNADIHFYAWLCRSAVALLKEQEPVKVKDYADIVDGILVGYCPKCDRKIVWNPEKEETVAFCKYCGKAVKWNEDQQISDC